MTSLNEIIQKKDREVQTLLFAYFIQRILERHPQHVLAIMAYGSYLNETTKSETSTPDFYVIVDDYKLFYKNPRDRFFNNNLPPNIYHLRTDQASCKYCVISLEHLEKEVSEKTKDVYHIGRFSKRMGLVWVKSKEIEEKIVQAQADAILTVSRKVLLSIDHDLTLDEFIKRALFLSYQGDVRIEAQDKIQKIIDSEKKYYCEVFQTALSQLGLHQTGSMYVIQKNSVQKTIDQTKFKKFIFESRIRARLRWPKNMFTVDNWLDYMLAKIERTQGIKIELTPTEKKYWYIFGWKHFLKLYRKKLIK